MTIQNAQAINLEIFRFIKLTKCIMTRDIFYFCSFVTCAFRLFLFNAKPKLLFASILIIVKADFVSSQLQNFIIIFPLFNTVRNHVFKFSICPFPLVISIMVSLNVGEKHSTKRCLVCRLLKTS